MFGKALAAFGERTDVHADSLPVAAAQTPTAAEPTSGKWNCGKCSNANDAGAMTCDLCTAPRHAPGVPAQAVMLAGSPQFSALGVTPVMPITSRNQVPQQPPQKYHQQQQQNAQFQMQQQAQPPRMEAAVVVRGGGIAGVLLHPAQAANNMFIMGFFIPLLALYVLL